MTRTKNTKSNQLLYTEIYACKVKQTNIVQALRQTSIVVIVSWGSCEDLGNMSSFPPTSCGHRRCKNLMQAEMNGSPCSRILSVSHLSNFRNSPENFMSINYYQSCFLYYDFYNYAKTTMLSMKLFIFNMITQTHISNKKIFIDTELRYLI